MSLSIFLFFHLLWIVLSIYVAKKRNRNRFLWGSLSVFFGLISLIVLSLLSKIEPYKPAIDPLADKMSTSWRLNV